MTVTGGKELKRNMGKAQVQMVDSLGAALMREGYEIQAQGSKITPVQFGVLRRSWYVAPPTVVPGKSPVVELGVGTSYALIVHEGRKTRGFVSAKQRRYFFARVLPELLRKPRKKVGGPKFITKIVDKRRSGYMKRIGDDTWRLFRRGIGVRAIPKLAPDKPSEESMEV